MTFFVLFLDSEGLPKNSQTSPFGNPIIKWFENRTDGPYYSNPLASVTMYSRKNEDD